MGVIRIIAYIIAAILIFFGVLFIWAAFGEVFTPSCLITGLVTIGIGFGIIITGTLVGRRAAKTPTDSTPVKLQIDLPANVDLDTIMCKSCGGSLTMDNIKMIAGAPVVSCPYCGTTYQLTEDPKW